METPFLVQHAANHEDAPQLDYAINLSTSGLFIRTANPAPQGSTVQVQFAPQRDAKLVVAFCEVTSVTTEGMGASFVNIDDDSLAVLNAALA